MLEENVVLLEKALEMTASSKGTSLGFVSNHVLARVRPLESGAMTQGGVDHARRSVTERSRKPLRNVYEKH